tara:strand:- start:7 stop:459 length:453 start_codon:yes stop_codon:yes gene_type:complete
MFAAIQRDALAACAAENNEGIFVAQNAFYKVKDQLCQHVKPPSGRWGTDADGQDVWRCTGLAVCSTEVAYVIETRKDYVLTHRFVKLDGALLDRHIARQRWRLLRVWISGASALVQLVGRAASCRHPAQRGAVDRDGAIQEHTEKDARAA